VGVNNSGGPCINRASTTANTTGFCCCQSSCQALTTPFSLFICFLKQSIALRPWDSSSLPKCCWLLNKEVIGRGVKSQAKILPASSVLYHQALITPFSLFICFFKQLLNNTKALVFAKVLLIAEGSRLLGEGWDFKPRFCQHPWSCTIKHWSPSFSLFICFFKQSIALRLWDSSSLPKCCWLLKEAGYWERSEQLLLLPIILSSTFLSFSVSLSSQ